MQMPLGSGTPGLEALLAGAQLQACKCHKLHHVAQVHTDPENDSLNAINNTAGACH